MNLHEYQAKDLFSRFDIPVPEGQLATSVEEARQAAKAIGGDRWVVKAQIHSGARGKAGGVKLVNSIGEVEELTSKLLGATLVTHQTGPGGLPCHSVYVEQPSDIARELYLSVLVDREQERILFMASAAGGMSIEEVAAETPEKIMTLSVHPSAGLQPYQARQLGFFMGLNKAQVGQFSKLLNGLYRMFGEIDASLVEINPLIVTEAGDLLPLDGKINLDDNALYRHKDIAELRDPSQEEEKERAAAAHGLNYITLDGDIGCMVNGAGLAMATMDLIKLHGGEPANFLDVGGGTTAERVAEAFKLIVSGADVKAILVNIFGGIVRCDLIAEGIIQAVQEVGITVPVIARLEGTNVEKGRELLENCEFDIIAANDLTDAAKRVVAAANGA